MRCTQSWQWWKCVFSLKFISASSCERNQSAHGHIHSKIRLEPATTEKLVYRVCLLKQQNGGSES